MPFQCKLRCFHFLLTCIVSQVTAQITRGQDEASCSFLLPFTTPAMPSSLEWYTCRDNDSLILSIEGLATIEDYQLLLQSVTYSNSAQEPSRSVLTRTLSVF